ncbi:MAG: hypothetical protein FJY86_01170 [Candidatus Diapherotrites archaeon]|uniref:Uncharacterized protein n=1 Tax=Candidatus Iainarchaeum sp. TaxID=3101447 RepID=A0A8T4CAF0_9ARCH|nr:hypothetical protein [Candidatus Diapherotrites archaeon]
MSRDDVRRALSNRRRDIQFIHELSAKDLLNIYDQLTTRVREGGMSDAQHADALVALRRINRELQLRLPGKMNLSHELQNHMDSLMIIRQRNGKNGNGGMRRNGNRGKGPRGNGRR